LEAAASAWFHIWFNVGVDVAVLVLFGAPLLHSTREQALLDARSRQAVISTFGPALRKADGGRLRRIEVLQHDDGKDRQRDAKADHEFSQR
jgi:hypothetical protein